MLIFCISAALSVTAVSFLIILIVDLFRHPAETKTEHAPLLPLTVIEALTMMDFGNTTPNLCILLSLGMNPLSVYPIVMTANAVGCAVGCIRFIKDGNHIRKAALIEGLSGTIGVLLAVRLVTSMISNVLQRVCVIGGGNVSMNVSRKANDIAI